MNSGLGAWVEFLDKSCGIVLWGGVDMTGEELRSLIVEKWTFSYDVQLRKVKGKLYFQVMWRYLEQASFPLSEAEFLAHFEEVAGYLVAWNVVEQVRGTILKTREKPRLGKAVNIQLDLGDRASEWILDEF